MPGLNIGRVLKFSGGRCIHGPRWPDKIRRGRGHLCFKVDDIVEGSLGVCVLEVMMGMMNEELEARTYQSFSKVQTSATK